MKKKKKRFYTKDNSIYSNKDIIRALSEDKLTNEQNSATIIKNEINKTYKETFAKDAYQNIEGGYGFNEGIAQQGEKFLPTRGLTWNFNRINEIYRSQPLMAKICNTKSYEMVKAGIDLRSSTPPDKISKIEKELKNYDCTISDALNWGFVFGLSACLIYLKGELNEESLKTPLDMDLVTKSSFIGLKTVIRWQGIQPVGGEYVKPEDVDKGYATVDELGEPLYYEVWFLNTTLKYKVHRSRLIIFNCNKLPGIENQVEQGAGVSEIERLWLPLLNYLATINYVQNMLQISQQRVLFLSEADRIGLLSVQGQKDFELAMKMIAKNADINNMLVLDQNDEYEYKSANFSNVDKIINAAQEDLAASANMPLNKLFGKSPTGLNNSSKENLTDFYDYILRLQNIYLRPAYEKLIPIIYKSTYGSDIEEFTFDFKSLFMPDEQEKALIIDRKTRPVEKSWESNGIRLYDYIQELREIGKVCDCFTNITDETLVEIEKNGLENARYCDFENGYIVNGEFVADIKRLKQIYKGKMQKSGKNKENIDERSKKYEKNVDNNNQND